MLTFLDLSQSGVPKAMIDLPIHRHAIVQPYEAMPRTCLASALTRSFGESGLQFAHY